jgi:superfamily I DNA/RNA helicase
VARILPGEPLGLASPEALKAYRLCRELPDGWIVWQNLSQSGPECATFWIVREADWSSLLLRISRTEASQALGPELFQESSAAFGDAEREWAERCRADYAGLSAAAALLFPNVPQDLLDAQDLPLTAGGRELCRPKVFEPWIASLMGPPSDPAAVQKIRERFCPEAVIPAEHTARLRSEESVVPELLTYRQEELLKADLDISPEGRRTAGQFGLLLVNGVAGSGKSLILLHRALLLQRFFPRSRILVLTCNKPLQLELRRRFARLGGRETGMEWLTFHAFCLKHWPGREAPRIADRSLVRAVLERFLEGFARERLERRHLEEEFAWIFEQGFPDRDAYVKAVRKGRGFRCGESLRERLWQAAGSYREELSRMGLSDWSLLALELRGLWMAEGATPPSYDAVLVDEAQFFAPTWFDVIRRILSSTGHLFLVADPTQGFLQRGASWKSQGLQVHGHSRRLERSHRTTRQILEAAWKFWRARTRAEDPDVVVPRTEGMAEGETPRLVRFESVRDELSWTVREAVDFVTKGGDPRHLLLLHEDWSVVQEMVERLCGRLGAGRAAEAREAGEDAVRVCSLNAATGLESPVVFVSGTALLFGKEGALLSDPEARETAAQETTRKLYMAFTRAGQRLVVTHVGEPPKSLLMAFG